MSSLSCLQIITNVQEDKLIRRSSHAAYRRDGIRKRQYRNHGNFNRQFE